jgi:hypothetical protein
MGKVSQFKKYDANYMKLRSCPHILYTALALMFIYCRYKFAVATLSALLVRWHSWKSFLIVFSEVFSSWSHSNNSFKGHILCHYYYMMIHTWEIDQIKFWLNVMWATIYWQHSKLLSVYLLKKFKSNPIGSSRWETQYPHYAFISCSPLLHPHIAGERTQNWQILCTSVTQYSIQVKITDGRW